MNNIEIIIQMTPNPNALKFVTNKDVISSGKASYNTLEQCTNPLAALLMAQEGIKQILFFENVITVTKHPHIDWDDLEEQIKDIMKQQMPEHDPNIQEILAKKPETTDVKVAPSVMNSKYIELNAIFDAMIRPGLQRDGGDIEITDIQDDVVKVNYQGACHSCPSASIGTLQFIQSVVNEYNPELRVELDDEEDDFW